MKKCVRCRQELSLSSFGADRSKPDGLRIYCRDCVKKENARRYLANKPELNRRCRAWEIKNRRKRFATRTKNLYGISVEDLARMENAQAGRCAICQEASDLVVDHCHSSGALRGLLCHHCNRAIGLFADDPDRMYTAAHYVRMGAYR